MGHFDIQIQAFFPFQRSFIRIIVIVLSYWNSLSAHSWTSIIAFFLFFPIHCIYIYIIHCIFIVYIFPLFYVYCSLIPFTHIPDVSQDHNKTMYLSVKINTIFVFTEVKQKFNFQKFFSSFQFHTALLNIQPIKNM